MGDSIDTLSGLSGLSRATMLELAEQVKANHNRLRGCSWHEFEVIPETADQFMKRRYRCTACNGEIDHHAYHWHEQGRRSRP